jgi:hypothetical protein
VGKWEKEWAKRREKYLVLPLLFLIQNRLLGLLLRILSPQLLQLCLLFFLSQRRNLFSALSKVDMFTKENQALGQPTLLKDIPRLPLYFWEITTYVFEAWNSACAMLLNFLPHSLHTIDLATSPSWRGAGSIEGFVSSALSALVISSRGLSWLSSSHWRAPCTVALYQLWIYKC